LKKTSRRLLFAALVLAAGCVAFVTMASALANFTINDASVTGWRRLWRQQIQDYLIAAIHNVRIFLANQNPKRSAAAAVAQSQWTLRLPLRFAY